MLQDYNNALPYHSSDSAVFCDGIQSTSGNFNTNAALVAADLKALIIYLTDPNQINYQFITDFLMTYRVYANANQVLHAIIDRLNNCFEYTLFDIERFERELGEEDSQHDEAEEEERFNSIKKILLRTFVLIRSWLLNYFVDDWLPDFDLRKQFVDYLNFLSVRFLDHNQSYIVDKFFIKIVLEMKKMWINICQSFWNEPDLKSTLAAFGIQNEALLSAPVANFIIDYELVYGPKDTKVDILSRELFEALDPKSRNSTMLFYNSLAPEFSNQKESEKDSASPEKRHLKQKKSVLDFFGSMGLSSKNLPLIKTSNSLSAFKAKQAADKNNQCDFNSQIPITDSKSLVLSKSKLLNNLNHLSPKNFFKSENSIDTNPVRLEENKDEIELRTAEPVRHDPTFSSGATEIKLLNFNEIVIEKQGQIIKGDQVEMFKHFNVQAPETELNTKEINSPGDHIETDTKGGTNNKSVPFTEPAAPAKRAYDENARGLKKLVKAWKKSLSKPLTGEKSNGSSKETENESIDKRTFQIVENLITESHPKPLSPIKSSRNLEPECPDNFLTPCFEPLRIDNNYAIDVLSARVVDELHYLKTHGESDSSERNCEDPDVSRVTERSLLTKFNLLKHSSVPQLLDDDSSEDKSSEWTDDIVEDFSQFHVKENQVIDDHGAIDPSDGKNDNSCNSFISVADIDWNNDSINFNNSSELTKNDEKAQRHSGGILDVTPSMIIDCGNSFDLSGTTGENMNLPNFSSFLTSENGESRFVDSMKTINRFSRSSLITTGSYISYDSKLSATSKPYLNDDDKSTSSLLFYKSNQQTKHLKPKVLQKVKSFEKMRIELERSVSGRFNRKNVLRSKKAFNNFRDEPSASKVKSTIHLFQESLAVDGLAKNNNGSAITFDSNPHSEEITGNSGNSYSYHYDPQQNNNSLIPARNFTPSMSTRKDSMVQSSIFSENFTLHSLLTSVSDHSGSAEELRNHLKHLPVPPSALRPKASFGNIRAFINGNTIAEFDNGSNDLSCVPQEMPRSETLDSGALIQTVMEMDSAKTSHNDSIGIEPCEPLNVTDSQLKIDMKEAGSNWMCRDKSNISMLSVASYHLPGINPEIIQTLANIPDESFHGEDPVSAALCKLEGNGRSNRVTNGDAESLVRKRKIPGNYDSDVGKIKKLHERKILQIKKNPSAKRLESSSYTPSKTIEEQVADLDICDSGNSKQSKALIMSQINSRFFQAFNSNESIFDSVPEIIKKINSRDEDALPHYTTSVFVDYKLSNSLLNVGEIMASQNHIPFILEFDSLKMAEQFSVIERDAMLEIDWKELVELYSQFSSLTGETHNSWLKILVKKDLKGIDIAVARFNLMVDWVISEILLTNNLKYRLMAISKFISIAEHCFQLQNYSTMMQIVLALTSEKISNLPNTWEKVSGASIRVFRKLEVFTNPMDQFSQIKQLNDNIVASKGCIPFIGLYISDLKLTFKQKPDFVTLEEAQKLNVMQTQLLKHAGNMSRVTIVLSNNFGKNIDNAMINWSKFFSASKIIKEMVGKIQYSKFYQFESDPELLSKCLYIEALSQDEMDLCVSKMTDP